MEAPLSSPAWQPFPRTRSGYCSPQVDTSAKVFDELAAGHLFLTLPVSSRKRLPSTWAACIACTTASVRCKVYDYADLNVQCCPDVRSAFAAATRRWGNDPVPASAVPGWPVEVPLPVRSAVERANMRQRAAAHFATGSTCRWRRLFADAACSAEICLLLRSSTCRPTWKALPEREVQARHSFFAVCRHCLKRPGCSASTPLGDSLDGWGAMEVDLLWAEGRVAIELDGAQHFDSVEAYRREPPQGRLIAGKRLTSCCGSSPGTWASTSTRCSTQSCERCRSDGGDRSGGGPTAASSTHAASGHRGDRRQQSTQSPPAIDARLDGASESPTMVM